MNYTSILTETVGRVAVITLNRPKALNALNSVMLDELIDALTAYDHNKSIGCIVITGSNKAFAAGADVKEMAEFSYSDCVEKDWCGAWEKVWNVKKPMVAAVAGFALGGGCELAMMCDIIIAADNACFGQPEITLGIMPGMGGSQRLTRLIGKSKAMDMILTGRMMKADEAERSGLASRVVSRDNLLDEAKDVAHTIAERSDIANLMAKEAVIRADQVGLNEGLLFERRQFHALFATDGQKEGMRAFIEKRPPSFQRD